MTNAQKTNLYDFELARMKRDLAWTDEDEHRAMLEEQERYDRRVTARLEECYVEQRMTERGVAKRYGITQRQARDLLVRYGFIECVRISET